MRLFKCLIINNCLIRNKVNKVKIKTNLELMKSIRKDWGVINPTTKVMKDKTKYTRKIKHKGAINHEYR